tara:strand:+ start:940 stop:1329 length:390 start_codon:yes stop_codon:yes gene_type:complete
MPKQITTPLPEVVDRYTIARLKLERLDETQIDIESMKDEIEYYKSGINFSNEELSILVDDLYAVNGKIWDTESSIRMGLDAQMTLDEVGRRALKVRDLNRIRMRVKNDIIDLTGDGFKDCKMNYAGSDE